MQTILLFLCAVLLLASANVQSQEDDEPAGEPPAAEAPVEDAPDEPPADEAVEPDDESYLDIEEEDFTPSEEIPADQSITFPTDI